MIYLVLKIFGYLLIALLAGFASGWLFRNLLAVKKDEELRSSLNDARSKLPQFESLLRGRDQQVKGLQDDLETRDQNIRELMDAANETEKALLKKTRELKRLTKNPANDDESVLADADIENASASNSSVEEGETLDKGEASSDHARQTEALKVQIVELEKELEQAIQATLQAEANALADTTDADRNSRQVQELEARLRQQAQDLERLSKSIEQ